MGVGRPGQPAGAGRRALSYLREHVGLSDRPRPPVALARVRAAAVPPGGGTLDRLRAILGADGVSAEHPIRVLHAAGKGYPDLVRMRAGAPEGAPDAVVFPRSHEQVMALLRAAPRASLAVVPFGGGTSVVGGVAPLGGEHAAVIALDTRRMAECSSSTPSRARSPSRAGSARRRWKGGCAGAGFTLGHYPQSFEYVSIGGCAATRSAGQASTGYGAIEKMVLGLRLAAPADEIALAPVPATAAGPGLRQLLVGSEGVLGVLTRGLAARAHGSPDGRIRGHVLPELRRGRGGAAAARRRAPLAARRGPPLRRARDPAVADAGRTGARLKGALTRAYLGVRGVRAAA